MDILFKTEDYVFSYRVAGICIQNGKVLLQKPSNDTAYAFPGGHVAFGETNAQTLVREFQEECGVDISVGDLKWVGEVFFPWGSKPCHQICLYYLVDIISKNIPLDGMFIGKEKMEGRKFDLGFHWVPVDELKDIEVYPTNVVELMDKMNSGVQHFIYKE
ncbi:MAG: NUDIX hydrolase [Erysipelotrichaceae bacterium]|nr:NUDIX hydrolase [Erysipelotrichaceae bacterium]